MDSNLAMKIWMLLWVESDYGSMSWTWMIFFFYNFHRLDSTWSHSKPWFFLEVVVQWLNKILKVVMYIYIRAWIRIRQWKSWCSNGLGQAMTPSNLKVFLYGFHRLDFSVQNHASFLIEINFWPFGWHSFNYRGWRWSLCVSASMVLINDHFFGGW